MNEEIANEWSAVVTDVEMVQWIVQTLNLQPGLRASLMYSVVDLKAWEDTVFDPRTEIEEEFAWILMLENGVKELSIRGVHLGDIIQPLLQTGVAMMVQDANSMEEPGES